MLPPMAIFFPLFALLEDSGFLPRIAYNLDKPFQRCRACGKQALTMCMVFGCMISDCPVEAAWLSDYFPDAAWLPDCLPDAAGYPALFFHISLV